jgi:hypothetical protein
VNRDRAERHLRLAAEAGLRRARALSDGRGGINPSTIFGDCVLRLNTVAMALTAVGALEAGRADDILVQFQAALAARRRLQPQTAGPLLRRGPRRMAAAVSAPLGRPASPPPLPPPWRLWPVGRMLPFRDEFVTGELYVLSLLVTAHRAHALIFASMRPTIAGGGPFTGFPEPFTKITATDDRGTAYQVNFRGGGTVAQWQGQLTIDPAPPSGSRWVELATGQDAPRLRIDLTVPPPAAEVTVRPRDGQPGEQLLEHAAQQILACADRPGDARRKAYGLGDVIGALEAAGALSPFSPVPGYLATVCERLGIEGHAITAAPTAALPGPWLSLLAWYGRRHRPPVHDGTAAAGTVLPDVDGAQVAVRGLHTRDNRTFLHLVLAAGTSAGPIPSAALLSHRAFSCWLLDDAGQWHVTVTEAWHSDSAGVDTGTLQVLPPLSRDCARVTLLARTPASTVRAAVPLRWWAAP